MAAAGPSSAADAPPTSKKRGINHATAQNDDVDDRQGMSSSSKRRKKKERKSKKLRGSSGNNSSKSISNQEQLLSKVLASRMDISPQVTSWPLWLRPDSSLIGGDTGRDACRKYAGSYYNATITQKKRKKCKCKICGESPLEHSLELDFGSSAGDNVSLQHLQLFVTNRNIRATAASALGAQRRNKGKDNAAAMNDYYSRAAKRLLSTVTSLCNYLVSMISAGESEILSDKCNALSRAVNKWCNRTIDSGGDGFDVAIRIIIASDVLYYRLYYLQLIGELPVLELQGDGGSNTSSISTCQMAYIPHPTTYFLVDYLCWDTVARHRAVRKGLEKQLEGEARSNKDVEDVRAALRYYLQEDGKDTQSEHHHPLSLLRQNRFAETYLYFSSSGWADDAKKERSFVRAAKKSSRHNASTSGRTGGDDPDDAFYTIHESPAPELLMEWRDSCRDFLCNLYAYATISPESIARIKSQTICSSIGIIEPGAGTGYVASLLQKAGLEAKPYDIVPPTAPTAERNTAINEYHGFTPSFTRVGNGGLDKLKRELQLPTSSIPVLLLCYPPPQSSMACDALRAYISVGGKLVIHIGEFQGLTGSAEFERVLTQKFVCIFRQPCLTWGTDAAEVTIWEAQDKNSSPENSHILIPCSSCKQKQSIKRCRFVRSLTYCSEDCYQQHKKVRTVHYACNMIPAALSNKGFFDDEAYMLDL